MAEDNLNNSFQEQKILDWNLNDDDIVISGISGRFPCSKSIQEFTDNLFAGKDMIGEVIRWKKGQIPGLTDRIGTVDNVRCFDAAFFGISPKQAQVMDPQGRLVLETTFEAILDSGYNPSEFKGSNTGVVFGVCFNDANAYLAEKKERIDPYSLTGTAEAMIANRISFCFDLKGPSYSVDTACSSSLMAFHQAICAIRSGEMSAAVVGGVNLSFRLLAHYQFQTVGVISPDGSSKSFDESANGYARAEAAVSILLQKAKDARRCYAVVLNSGCNTDGMKAEGIGYPSGKSQEILLEKVYSQINLDPNDVNYIEAHGTGTKAGDPEEGNALDRVFFPKRQTPLLIGSVKSNAGHSESAAGAVSVVKVIIAMENGMIPGNLHYKTPNSRIPGLLDGRLKVVDRNLKWDGGVVGINSFGFGGANTHIILRSYNKPKSPSVKKTIPRVIGVSGMTRKAVESMLTKIGNMPRDDEMMALLHSIFSKKIVGHPYRGFVVLSDTLPFIESMEDNLPSREVWYIFNGMGCQWNGMGKSLLSIDVCARSLHKCANILDRVGLDLLNLLTTEDDSVFDTSLNVFVCITAIQIALVDLLSFLGVSPDRILGHSAGEMSCGYADGCFTAEQSIMASYIRGKCISDSKLINGAMAAVAMSWEELQGLLPEGIYGACNNAADSVTVSGPLDDIDKFIAKLKAEGKFAKKVNSGGIAAHSKYILPTKERFLDGLKKIIPEPKKRSGKWLSTSVPKSDWDSPLAALCSPEYHVNNMLAPVLFYNVIQEIPENALVIEIGPHSLLQALIKRVIPKSCINVGLTNKNSANQLDHVLKSIGRLHNAGLSLNLKELYPPISFPVSRGTPSISSLVEWDHSQEWTDIKFSEQGVEVGETIVEVNMSESDSIIAGHKIDGKVLYPATGYLIMVWKTFAKMLQKEYNELPVVFEEVELQRAIVLPKEGTVKFAINIFRGDGAFEICERETVVAKGKIRSSEGISKEIAASKRPLKVNNVEGKELLKDDIYKEFRLRGYEYGGLFKGIIKSNSSGTIGEVEWNNDWISYLDTVLQFLLIKMTSCKLFIPTGVRKFVIDPLVHCSMLQDSNSVEVKHFDTIGVLMTHGVEISGMRFALTSTKQYTHPPARLEKHTFVPFKTAKTMQLTEVLHLLVALATENQIRPNSTVKITEAVSKDDKPIIEYIQDVFELELKKKGDFSLATTTNPPKLPNITIIKKDLLDEPVDSNCHLLIGTKLLTSNKLLKNALECITDEGFILSVEGHKFIATELKKIGNLVIISELKTEDNSIILLRKANESLPTKVICIKKSHYKWLDELKTTLKEENNKILIVSDDDPQSGILGFFNCLKLEADISRLRCIFTDGQKFSLESVNKDLLRKDLIVNVLKNGEWGTYRHITVDSNDQMLEVEHCYINTLTRGDLSSLRWIEGPLSLYKKSNYPNVEFCTVYNAALNFRDIMIAAGKLSPDSIPGDAAGQDCILGLEFSGRDSNGNRVMGIIPGRGLATSVLVEPDFLYPVPDNWTLEQAATIPVVYLTCYYALIIRGNMRKGESILIHAGSGGVGLAAITIALSMGCRVFATVGTPEKREFVKRKFPQILESHIGNSRDTSFEEMVLQETDKKGVDLVLNSLAEEKLQASLRCLGKNGRFLEIGKVDLAKNNKLGMEIFLKNITFHGVLLDEIIHTSSSKNIIDRQKVRNLLSEGIKSGVVQPLPVTTFSDAQVEAAARYMSTGKHIGKVVIQIRNEEESIIVKNPQRRLIRAVPRTYFYKDKSYIIIGGLGGLGLEVAKWMISRGAMKLVLVSRNGVANGYQDWCIRRWKSSGVTIVVSTVDSSNIKGANELISQANKLDPVGGIFNLAVVLHDSLISNLTQENFLITRKGKVDVMKSLDIASRSCTQLDYFVGFSSIACGRGNMGQTCYGMANSVMERICEERRANGLPGLAIQWGPIGDVGIFVDGFKGACNETVIEGLMPQRIASCMETLDFMLQQPYPILSSMVVADKTVGEKSSISITNAVANILGIRDVNNISPSTTLGDLGIDSLMSSELKQTLEMNYDIILNPNEIRKLTFQNLKELQEKKTNDEYKEKNFNGEENIELYLPTIETLIRMPAKQHSNGSKPLFLVHSVTGTTKELNELSSHLPFVTWGLHCTMNAPIESIQALAEYYVEEVKIIESSNPLLICGYSFGATVAFEMALKFEAEGREVKLFMIDGSPDLMKLFIDLFITKEAIDENDCFCAFIQFFFKMGLDNYKKTLQEIINLPDIKSKVEYCSNLLNSKYPYITTEALANATYCFYSKLKAMHSYKTSSTFKGNLVLFKAEKNYVQLDKDYGLNKICEQPVEVISVEANHQELITGEFGKSIAEKIIKSVKL